jgi:hypothetical protein
MSEHDVFTPELPVGFVAITHPDIPGATAEIPEAALAVHEARGWQLVADGPTPTTTKDEAP